MNGNANAKSAKNETAQSRPEDQLNCIGTLPRSGPDEIPGSNPPHTFYAAVQRAIPGSAAKALFGVR
jgi:hypothetical protein